MTKNELIQELGRLPIHERLYVIERLLHSIRVQADQNQMQEAADTLYQDYKQDQEVTAFTDIDLDNFYETR